MWDCLRTSEFVSVLGIPSDREWKYDEIQYLWLIRRDDVVVGITSDCEWEYDTIQYSWMIRWDDDDVGI